MVTKTETISNQRFITSYSYDEQSRITSMTYPSGKVIGYGYDDKGELMSISIDGIPFIKDIKTNDNGLLSYPNYTEKVNYNAVSRWKTPYFEVYGRGSW